MKEDKRKLLRNKSILEFLDRTSTSYKYLTKNDAQKNSSINTLIQLFEILLSNINFYREKLLTGGDDEDLHQFRIACRRSIVLMGEFKFLYKKEKLLKHRTGLKNLISISNSKRDMDVLKNELCKIKKEKNVSYDSEALDVLKESVEKILQEEYLSIITYLESETCTNVLLAWKNYIRKMNRTDIFTYGKYPIDSLSKYVIFQRFLKIKKKIKGLV